MPKPAQQYKLPRGMGRLIRYTSNGPWSWQYWDRARKKWASTPTEKLNKSEAEQWVYQQVSIRSEDRFRYQGINILFSTVADEYIHARTIGRGYKKLRASSLKILNGSINAFKKFIGSGYAVLCIDQIDRVMLQQFLEAETRRITATVANRNLNFIGQILNFAQKNNYIMHNPASKVERAVQTNETETDQDDGLEGWACPTPDDVRQILANSTPKTASKDKRAYNGSDQGRPVYSGINKNDYTDLYAAICLTGMRIGEACYLTWADVDLVNKVLLIRAGKKNGKWWQPKTKLSIRRIAIVPDLEVILNRLRLNNRKKEWVFETKRGTQCHPHNVSKRFREICDGLSFEKHYVVHSLRKYWASTVAQQGLDWKLMIKMFGHSDFELILRVYYAQNDDARLVAEASKIDFGLGLSQIA